MRRRPRPEGYPVRVTGPGGAVFVAEDHYLRAMALREELGMRPLVAHCHLGLGKLYQRSGKRQEAREHLTTAITLYRAMDMSFWREKAEAELRAL